MQNLERNKNLVKIGSSFVILLIHLAIWSLVWIFYYAPLIPRTFGYKGHLLVVCVYAVIVAFFTKFYGGYRVGYYRPSDVALSGITAVFFANFITYLQTCMVGAAIMDAWPFLAMLAVQSAFISIWALLVGRIYAYAVPAHKMLLVYGGSDLAQALIYKMLTRAEKYKIQESINISEELDVVKDKIMQFSVVILCDVPSKLRNNLLKFCFEKSIRTYTTSKISDILIRSATDMNLFDTPLLLNRNKGISFEENIAKRAIDIILSILGLIFSSPILVLAAIAIRIYDGGPVFYSQERLTLNEKVFKLYKFRSMCQNAEAEGITMSLGENDDRITPIGRILRKFRIDELPQLFNILRGEMSIVGPRPERPEIASEYIIKMPEFNYRLKVKAGLTGFAQVVGRYNTTPYDKLKLDLMYIANYSLLEDFKIIMTTIKIIFVKDSTQGIAIGSTTAQITSYDDDISK